MGLRHWDRKSAGGHTPNRHHHTPHIDRQQSGNQAEKVCVCVCTYFYTVVFKM